MLDPGRAIWNLCKIVPSGLFLGIEAEAAMVCRNRIDLSAAHGLAQRIDIFLFPERRRADVFGALKILFRVIAVIKQHILRAGLHIDMESALIAACPAVRSRSCCFFGLLPRMADFLESELCTEMHDIDRRIGQASQVAETVYGFGFHFRRPAERMSPGFRVAGCQLFLLESRNQIAVLTMAAGHASEFLYFIQHFQYL